MKNIKPFGPTIGITKIKKNLIQKLNNEFDLKSTTKKKDYSSKLASQIQNEVLFSKDFVILPPTLCVGELESKNWGYFNSNS